MTVSVLGLATGPGDLVIAPVADVGLTASGAAAGFMTGLANCGGTFMGGSGGGGGGGGGGKQGKFWKSLKNYRNNIKTNGLTGKARRFFQWDYTHGDVEVYDRQGNHLGLADPETGTMTKPAVPGRGLTL